jgi:hypothetical protein
MCSACPEPTPAQKEALDLDGTLVPVARGAGVIELALGTALDLLFRGDRLAQLGCSREADYARERMGVPPSTMFQWLRLARELKHRPLLRAAVLAGRLSTRKALAVLPLAEGDLEARWTEAAMRLTLREIASAARAAGKEDPEERFESDTLVLPMTAGQQARLDAALALAKEDIGPEARRWQCLEALSDEWLSEHPAPEREGASGAGPSLPPDPGEAKLLARQLAVRAEAFDFVRKEWKEPPPDDALGLDGLVKRLLLVRRENDEAFGALALRAREGRVHAVLGYGTFEAYCEERLGLRAATVRQRIWLERRMRRLPRLREALRSGRLTYSKALAVARHAKPSDVEARIERAAATTCQQTEREGEEEEDRKNRGAGVRKVWGPKEAVEAVKDAIASARAWSKGRDGKEIDDGEALAVVADHFVEVTKAHRPPGGDRIDPKRREVLMRKAGLCAVPGCSRAACHLHHLVYRSRGGSDDPRNLVGLCAVHHLHGIHLGYLEVTGVAGERLHWKLGTGEAVPLEEWVTHGDDDVRRAGGAGAADEASRPDTVTDAESDGAGFVSEGTAEYRADAPRCGRREVATAA